MFAWLRFAALGAALGVAFSCSIVNAPEDPTEAAGGGGTNATGGGGSDAGGQLPYGFRRAVTIAPQAPDGYSVAVKLDHAALVSDGKALESGNDVRVFLETDGSSIEIPRVLDVVSAWGETDTTIWFRTQPDAGTYFVYYGSPSAGAAPADAVEVFDVFDDFNDNVLDPAWADEAIGGATGLIMEINEVVRINGTTGAIGGVADSFMFLHREISGNFIAETKIEQVGGNRGGDSRLGGLMIRQSAAEDSRNLAMSLRENPRARIATTRATDGADTTQNEIAGGDTFPQLFAIQRQGVSVLPLYSDDGKIWVGLGSPASLTFDGPVRLGIPFANASSGEGWVEVDWIRVRKLTLPEPNISLEPEEAL